MATKMETAESKRQNNIYSNMLTGSSIIDIETIKGWGSWTKGKFGRSFNSLRGRCFNRFFAMHWGRQTFCWDSSRRIWVWRRKYKGMIFYILTGLDGTIIKYVRRDGHYARLEMDGAPEYRSLAKYEDPSIVFDFMEKLFAELDRNSGWIYDALQRNEYW